MSEIDKIETALHFANNEVANWKAKHERLAKKMNATAHLAFRQKHTIGVLCEQIASLLAVIRKHEGRGDDDGNNLHMRSRRPASSPRGAGGRREEKWT